MLSYHQYVGKIFRDLYALEVGDVASLNDLPSFSHSVSWCRCQTGKLPFRAACALRSLFQADGLEVRSGFLEKIWKLTQNTMSHPMCK